MSCPERSRNVRFGPVVPDERVMLGRSLEVAPERASRTDATDGSVRDRQALQFPVGGLFYCGITAVSSRAEVLDVNAKIAGLGLPGAPKAAVAACIAHGLPKRFRRDRRVITHPAAAPTPVMVLADGLVYRSCWRRFPV